MTERCDTIDITILGETLSPTLKRIAFTTNHVSNNLFAETLLKTLGKELDGGNTYEVSCLALEKALNKMGLDTRSLHIQDGSGLSRQNYVSADFFCRFLKRMMDSPAYNDFLYGLPYPGGNGSLQYNMKNYPYELRSRIKVKSGSMTGVRCYSGYILPSVTSASGSVETKGLPEGALIISIMTNNCTSPTWKVRPLLDRLMVALAKHN